jgi:hypothetical protein
MTSRDMAHPVWDEEFDLGDHWLSDLVLFSLIAVEIAVLGLFA